MNSVIVKQGQNLLDIAVVHCGDVSSTFEIAQLNQIPLTSNITPGQVLIVPARVKKNIVALFNSKNYPATGIPSQGGSFEVEVAVFRGIGYMQIGSTFKVS